MTSVQNSQPYILQKQFFFAYINFDFDIAKFGPQKKFLEVKGLRNWGWSIHIYVYSNLCGFQFLSDCPELANGEYGRKHRTRWERWFGFRYYGEAIMNFLAFIGPSDWRITLSPLNRTFPAKFWAKTTWCWSLGNLSTGSKSKEGNSLIFFLGLHICGYGNSSKGYDLEMGPLI